MTNRLLSHLIFIVVITIAPGKFCAAGATDSDASPAQVFEWSFGSRKVYQDPFNDVEVDVIFTRNGGSWRVPAFWRGSSRWSVRFSPPMAGEYAYRIESTDKENPELNRSAGHVRIAAYAGSNELLRHGALRVSANGRYFEHADGTPFYWLGDTWWTGLSDRLSWTGFQQLTQDRKRKGFTLIQTVAGLIPFEESPPLDPGACNEGGPVWVADFARVNPRYFDYADRRIQYLVDAGMVPAIVGGWNKVLQRMGVEKMKRHWRYLIARFGAYPVLWIVGGEVNDPSDEALQRAAAHGVADLYESRVIVRGWTEVARYIRTIDPYHHPITVHESSPPFDTPLQDETLTDFDMVQSGHFGWNSLATEVAQINMHYARSKITKPIVQGEIGYEKFGESFFEDFQRAAFWLSMLNGAAGHTYGANGTWESYTADKPLQRIRWSLLSWQEGMKLPGSNQVGLASKLLRQYPWWRFTPHPEWISPHGTTLLEPQDRINGFNIGSWDLLRATSPDELNDSSEGYAAAGEWTARRGNFRLPYAAGVPKEVRVVYMPNFGAVQRTPPTILGLEIGVRYHAFLWEPTTGTKVHLGAVERPAPGPLVFADSFDQGRKGPWEEFGLGRTEIGDGGMTAQGDTLTVLDASSQKDAVVAVSAQSESETGLVLRYRDQDNYIAGIYSPEDQSIWLFERKDGRDGPALGRTIVSGLAARIRVSAEVRGDKAIASVSDGQQTYTTPIVDVGGAADGRVGIRHRDDQHVQRFEQFELRGSASLIRDDALPRRLYDANGRPRGDLVGTAITIGSTTLPAWDAFGHDKHILLDAYRPERLPMSGDWVLVLEAPEETKR